VIDLFINIFILKRKNKIQKIDDLLTIPSKGWLVQDAE
jgi:hypothetical protein